jgi:pimeloyl-ACP methyl ester carboxylesterase
MKQRIHLDDVALSCIVEGHGPLVVMLHGFPETSYAWRKQIPALAEHFRVVAPDMRGYGESEKPARVRDYRIGRLTADVVGLIHALGEDRAHVVGHDWGGAVAWATAQAHPEAVERLAVINAPHPAAFLREMRRFSRQVLRSWYILFFQLPRIPERALLLDGAARIARLLRDSALGDAAFSEADLLEYRRAFSLPGVATASLSYYRAVFRDILARRLPDAKGSIHAPTLLIWGENDIALGTELTYGLERFIDAELRIERVPNTSHWVNEERPELVNRLLIEFLSEPESSVRQRSKTET